MITANEKVESIENRLISSDQVFGQGSTSAWDEALWIVMHAMNNVAQPDTLDWQQSLDQSQIESIDALVELRISERKPLAYLLGEVWFAGHRFFVDERVIIPRSYLVEWIDDQFAPWIPPGKTHRILDMCTGSGCIGISTAIAFENAKVTLSDISPEAIEVARINIAQHKLQDRVEAHCGDMFDGLTEPFDLIVCNPPYVSEESMQRLPEEFRHEPALAFSGGENGLDFVKVFLQQAHGYLSDHGHIIMEAGSASNALEDAFPDVPFTWLSTEYDEMVVLIISRAELQEFRNSFGF